VDGGDVVRPGGGVGGAHISRHPAAFRVASDLDAGQHEGERLKASAASEARPSRVEGDGAKSSPARTAAAQVALEVIQRRPNFVGRALEEMLKNPDANDLQGVVSAGPIDRWGVCSVDEPCQGVTALQRNLYAHPLGPLE